MFIDFNKLNADSNLAQILDPIQIFDVLPRKSTKYAEYLRDVQSTVLEKWFREYRENKNTVIKMNTGSGKTVVGLLILKSYLNESKGPAVYVVPDNYLVDQVIREAIDLGIPVTTDARSTEFKRGKEILVANMHKIINGRSVFGIGTINQHIGCMIVDDAHSCIKVAETQFTISISSDTELYNELLALFSESIKQQSEQKLLEITSKEEGTQQVIPFWDWNQNLDAVRSSLHKNKDNELLPSLFFNWPLIKNNLELSSCIFTSKEILISSDYIPIEVIPSFNECPHKVFMSATIDDDSVLISHFNVDENQIKKAVTPKIANDIGERMILIPQEINPKIEESELKDYFKWLAQNRNVIILVPSYHRAKFWEDIANVVVKSSFELKNTINDLKEKHVGMVVLINKYDGIDLPKNACEILVLDGVPDVRNEFDKVEQIILRGSKEILKNTIQRIEQGMGRGIRSKDDHCIVFLIGNSLVENLYHRDSEMMFTEATRKQLELSRNLTSQIQNSSLTEIDNIVQMALTRDQRWIETSRSVLVSVKYNDITQFEQKIIAERKAFNFAQLREYRKARDLIQELVNQTSENSLKGYLKYKLARYENFFDATGAQQTIKSAKKLNNQLIHPIEGIEYEKVQFDNIPQADKINRFLMDKYKNTNEYIIGFNSVIDKLIFAPNSSSHFEQAFKELGEHLGYSSQRPEIDFKKGPDNLWRDVNNKYFVIECKNEATTEKISKGYCNQLNGSVSWFLDKYPDEHCIPILIHPSNTFEHSASPLPQIRIINEDKLEILRKNLRSWSIQISDAKFETNKIAALLKLFNLESGSFIENYTIKFSN